MKELKGSETEKNLLKAFAGESQAKNRYQFFGKIARKEGYEKVADFFDETARNEEEHGKLFFKELQGGMVEITASYPAGVLSNTIDNLAAAGAGEYEEWRELYPAFAEVAASEGFSKIASLFRNIAEIEKHHEERYNKLRETIVDGKMFKKDDVTLWRCKKCGHEQLSGEAPNECPVCKHAQGYFEIDADTF